MGDLDYIKSYLVKLGVDVSSSEIAKWDSSLEHIQGEFEKTSQQLSKSDKKVQGSLGNTIKRFFNTWKGAATILGSASAGISKFVQSTAEADMNMQRFARSMYMSTDQAKALSSTLDAMNLSQGDLMDVAHNPELLKQYKDLLGLAKSFRTPPEVKETFREIRSITAEFQKFKIIFDNFRERLAHFIYKVVRGPAIKFKEFLSTFNSRFANNINNWAEKLGKFLGVIVRLALRAAEIIKNLADLVLRLWNRLSLGGKIFIGMIYAVNRIIKASPLGKFIMMMTAILALIDDYKTYREGGKSTETLKPVWEFVGEQIDNPDSLFNSIVSVIELLIDKLNELIQWLKNRWGNREEEKERMKSGEVFEENGKKYRYVSKPILFGLASVVSREEVPRLNNEEIFKYATPQSLRNKTSLQTTNTQTLLSGNNSKTQNFIFNISGAKSPQETADVIASYLRNNRSVMVGE